MAEEGIVKFRAEHRLARLDLAPFEAEVEALLDWRQRLYEAGLVGRDPARYEGAGYGNLSVRLEGEVFLVTGSQTGGVARLGPEHLCRVDRAFPEENRVESTGPVLPSSESMTHAAVYAARPEIRYVFHAHSPELFQAAPDLGLPGTPATVPYGTPEMSQAVYDLLARTPDLRLFVMYGHEDGVVSLAESAAEAGEALRSALTRAADV